MVSQVKQKAKLISAEVLQWRATIFRLVQGADVCFASGTPVMST